MKAELEATLNAYTALTDDESREIWCNERLQLIDQISLVRSMLCCCFYRASDSILFDLTQWARACQAWVEVCKKTRKVEIAELRLARFQA